MRGGGEKNKEMERRGAKDAKVEMREGRIIRKIDPPTMAIQRVLSYHEKMVLIRGDPTPHYGTNFRMGGFPFCL